MMTLMLLVLLAPQDDEIRRAKELIRLLDDTDVQKRDDADRELRKLAPNSDPVEQLLREAAGAERVGEGKSRAQQILKIRAAARLVPDPEEFIARLQSVKRDERSRAMQRLSSYGPRAAPLAVDLLGDADRWIQQNALRLIGLSGDSRYVESVRPLVAGDNDTRTTALDCLSRLGDLSIRAKLREVLPSAGWAFGSAVEALVRLRQPEDIPYLQTHLRSDDRNVASIVVRAIRSWDRAKEELYDDLRRLAGDGFPEAMLVAADTGKADLAPVLRDACRRGDSLPQAAFALAALGDRESIPYLMNVARYGSEPGPGICGLGRLKSREALWLFRKMVSRGEDALDAQLRRVLSEVELVEPQTTKRWRFEFPARRAGHSAAPRVQVAWALGEIGGDEAESLLVELLDDDSENVRYEACVSLGRLKSRRGIAKIGALLDDAVAFRRFSTPAAGPLYDAYLTLLAVEPWSPWAQVRESAVSALEAIAGEAKSGTLDEQVQAWRLWVGKQKP